MYKLFGALILCFVLTACTSHNGASSFLDERTLIIADSQKVTALDPLKANLASHRRLINIYEPLVKKDATLRITPALAESWGSLKPNVIQMKLRQNVVFHDGSSFDADDVLYSFQQAANPAISNIAADLEGIQIAKTDQHTITLTTATPDPTLLNKLSLMYILPQEYKKGRHVGTAAFKLVSQKADTMSFQAFPGYWGTKAPAANAIFKTLGNKQLRIQNVNEKTIDILLDTPPEVAHNAEAYDTLLAPGLDPVFLMFNNANTSSPLRDPNIKEAINLAIDREAFKKISEDIIVAKEFVSSAIFGFDPKIKLPTRDVTAANTLIEESAFPDGFVMELVTQKQNAPVAELIQKDLREIGINIQITTPPINELLAKITDPKTEMFLLGWQFKSGDSASFFSEFLASSGASNLSQYSNEQFDSILKQALTNIKPKERLGQLQEMIHITQEDKPGIPLFETTRPYLIKQDIDWQPRLDSLIEIANIKPRS